VYTGTLGPSIRTIVPVRNASGKIVGLVSAGITQQTLAERRQHRLTDGGLHRPAVFGDQPTITFDGGRRIPFTNDTAEHRDAVVARRGAGALRCRAEQEAHPRR
jgi:hypothetical protein